MGKGQKYQWVFIVLFALSLVLHLGLALVNREANDDHMKVVHIIMETWHLPTIDECRECFHVKLFYVTVALLLQGFGISTPTSQIIFVQLLNLIAGMFTLVVIYKFIQEYPSDNELLKLFSFALVALNPKIIAIQSQASNDTFAILFSSLALFFTYRFLKTLGKKDFGWLIFFILLAVSAKVTSWIVFAAIFLSFLFMIWVQAEKISQKLTYIAILLVSVIALTAINPLSQFVANTQKFGKPIVSPAKRMPLPGMFQQTSHYKNYFFKPGIVSIQDGFLTFKLVDLLKYPLTTNGEYEYPPQRTSLWTMLYADSHSLHFQNWPPSWQTNSDENFSISRGIFILALPPTLIFLAGFLLELFTFLMALFKRDKPKIRSMSNALFLLTFGGYIASLALAALLYRDFTFIKLTYLLPGLLAFTWLFLRGAEPLFNMLAAHGRWATWLISCLLIALMGFYMWDVLAMIYQLYNL